MRWLLPPRSVGFPFLFSASLLAWWAIGAASEPGTPSQEAATGLTSAPKVIARGAHHRVWEWTTKEANEAGQEITVTHSFNEIASGLHYQDDEGQFQESVAAFEPTAEGFVAIRGPHQAALASDISVPGAVTLVTPEGQVLRSTPTLLAYLDQASGQQVRLADVQSAAGEMTAPGTVLYPAAFDTVAASVRVIYSRGGFECDVILHSQLPDPSLFGLNPATTELVVYSEFFDTVPETQQDRVVPGVDGEPAPDVRLTFGSMIMDRGRAFGLDDDAGHIPVRKTWVSIEGRHFLMEHTAYPALRLLLSELPEAAAPSPSQRRAGEHWKRTAKLDLRLRQGRGPAWSWTPRGRLAGEFPAIRSGRPPPSAAPRRPCFVRESCSITLS